ncbi:MAG: hypothetical protein AAGG46_02750 [Planctomycetota bacterium]
MNGRVVKGVLSTAAVAVALQAASAFAGGGWDGKRKISYQDPNDLFYNYYVGPEPSGTAAEMYVAPLPVPERVGHTYNTYQPLYPHEHLYQHNRSWYTHNPGAGWTRTKVRYRARNNWVQAGWYKLNDGNPWVILPRTTPLDPR